MKDKDLAVYVHLPFCKQKCPYCGFFSEPYGRHGLEGVNRYVEAVIKEVCNYSSREFLRQKVVSSIYFGGGTPTLIGGDGISRLICVIKSQFRVSEGAEVTVEANPSSVDVEMLEQLRASGVTRLSLGVQSFDEKCLRILGRTHSVQDAVKAISLAKRVGFNSVNVDLIFGVPGQSLQSWARDLEVLAELGADHVSTYGLTLEEGTLFEKWVAAGKLVMPSEDEEADMYDLARSKLAEMGYVQYEVSNFAKPGHECVHNIAYWRNCNYLGLGAGAHSHLKLDSSAFALNLTRLAESLKLKVVPCECGCAVRFWNVSDIKEYSHRIYSDVEAIEGMEVLTPQEELRDSIIMGLRLLQGIPIHWLCSSLGVDLEELFPGTVQQLVEQGILEVSNGVLRLTSRALPVANVALREFALISA